MQGEPCVDEWPGVTCCLPALDNPNISCNVDGWSQSRVYPLGCSTGTYTGTPVDMAKCVITELKLSANNLVGPLMPSLANLTDLVTVDLRQNDLQVPSSAILPAPILPAPSLPTPSSTTQFHHTQFDHTQFPRVSQPPLS